MLGTSRHAHNTTHTNTFINCSITYTSRHQFYTKINSLKHGAQHTNVNTHSHRQTHNYRTQHPRIFSSTHLVVQCHLYRTHHQATPPWSDIYSLIFTHACTHTHTQTHTCIPISAERNNWIFGLLFQNYDIQIIWN